MIVMKFGGTSVGNAERIANVANIVHSYIKKNPVVVVSAVTKITDALIQLAKECSEGNGEATLESIKKIHYEIVDKLNMEKSLIEEEIALLSALANKTKNKPLDAKILDEFQSFGERISSKIVASQLNKIGVKAKAFNSWEFGFITTSDFGNAEPLESAYANINKNINKNIKKLNLLPVITGFIGKTEKGEITTLGRGGSDYTAAIIGSAINADEIQIWTDVNGIMSADPRIVENAVTLDKVSFIEASELAYFGAKVLHPKTILPAVEKNIPVKVLNSFNPQNKGTTIVNDAEKSSRIVKAITNKKNAILIDIESSRMLGAYGFLAKLFNIFSKYKKSVDVVSTSEVSVSLTVDNDENLDSILNELKNIGNVDVFKNQSIVCAVGSGIRDTPRIAGKIFTALGNNNINVEMISQGASRINITFIVDGKDAENAIKVLHKEFYG